MGMAHSRRTSPPEKRTRLLAGAKRGELAPRRRMRTSFLFSTPSFWSGMGSVLDLSGHPGRYLSSRTGREADAKALYGDYRMIGQDIGDAIVYFVVKNPQTAPALQERLFDPDETERAP